MNLKQAMLVPVLVATMAGITVGMTVGVIVGRYHALQQVRQFPGVVDQDWQSRGPNNQLQPTNWPHAPFPTGPYN